MLFFSPLCLQYMELVDDEIVEGAKELKTLTSNRCSSGCCPKVGALMASFGPLLCWCYGGRISPQSGAGELAHLCKEICCDVSNVMCMCACACMCDAVCICMCECEAL